MKPFQITPPVELPVTRDAFKAHVRVDYDDDDTLLDGYIAAAVAHLDGYTGILGRCICTQTWGVPFTGWMGRFTLPFPDAQSVVVKYLDTEGAEQTLPASQYELVSLHSGPQVRLKTTSSTPVLQDDVTLPVTIEMTAGYGGADDVPGDLKQAIMLLAGHWYENRSAVADKGMPLPMGFDQIVGPRRWGRV